MNSELPKTDQSHISLPDYVVEPIAEVKKCCRTCFWSSPIPSKSEHDVAEHIRKRLDCNWELDPENKTPISMHTSTTFVYEDDGEFCSCYKGKE